MSSDLLYFGSSGERTDNLPGSVRLRPDLHGLRQMQAEILTHGHVVWLKDMLHVFGNTRVRRHTHAHTEPRNTEMSSEDESKSQKLSLFSYQFHHSLETQLSISFVVCISRNFLQISSNFLFVLSHNSISLKK